MPAHIRNAGHTGRFLRSDGGKVSREAAAAGAWAGGPAAAQADAHFG
jgi:hypothetical protein